MSRQDMSALPFKSHTQVREFSTLALYKSALTEQQRTALAEHLQIQPMKGFRQQDILSNFPGVEDKHHTLGMTVYHNVRVYCKKPVVSFPVKYDPYGREMFQVCVFDALKGYAEPKD